VDPKRLNIIHLVEPGSGGAMRHVLDLARAQADVSHNVTIIYSPLRLEADYEAQLRQLPNVALHELLMRRAPHVSDIQNLFELVKILRAEQVDILHAHSTKAGLLARLARIFVRMRVIYTPHGMMTLSPKMPQWKKTIYAAYEKILACFTDKIIVLSRHERDHAVSLGLSADKLMMAQNGAAPLPPSDRAALRAAQNILDHQQVVGFVGRMAFPKNPDLAVAAFAAARNQLPNLVLYMIGDGELMLPCLSMAEAQGLSDDIRWLGGVDARPHYAAMDMLLVTSGYEAMAYSFLEALRAGLPIVTTDVGGSDSCVIPGQTGEVTLAEPDQLANGIVKVLGDPARHDAMRSSARALGEQFGIPQMLQSVMAVYKAALDHKSAELPF
jgi:glycosyltransferase involved in cell wall biosynthesis